MHTVAAYIMLSRLHTHIHTDWKLDGGQALCGEQQVRCACLAVMTACSAARGLQVQGAPGGTVAPADSFAAEGAAVR